MSDSCIRWIVDPVVGEVLIFVSDCEIRGFDCLIVGEVGLC